MLPKELVELVKNGALVISGSRSIVDCEAWAKWMVYQAYKRKWAIVVGDASGADTAVINMAYGNVPFAVLGCEAVGNLRVDMFHLYELGEVKTELKPRFWLVPGGSVKGSCFAIRDKVLAELASTTPKNGFLGLWDGQSKGTLLTASFCKSRNIPGVIYKRDGFIHERWEKRP